MEGRRQILIYERAFRVRTEERKDCHHQPAYRQFPRQPRRPSFLLRAGRRQDRGAGNHPMSFDLELSGRRALVTGGAKGVGASVVAVLRDVGAKVITTARSAPKALPEGVHFVAAALSTEDGCAIAPE